ncbi:MAG: NUDIX domain-containing protein [Bacteroides sp.]|nr:NUDIX domain-containing protein [Bacteroides sp.]MCM1550716.1 NUDIX domain-containing protein [Clostridium sp.]
MSEHINNLTTLCYIEQDDRYLMLHRVKKKQDVNQDKWIGIGGHFEAGESPEECLLREVWEETGLRLTSWQFRGIITFTFQNPQSPEHKEDLTESINDTPKSEVLKRISGNGKVVEHGVVQSDMEYMCLYTADGFEGRLTDCEEGTLEWIEKSQIQKLPIWEGDRIFFHLLETGHPFFSLKLDYAGERLERAVLDGTEMELLDIRREDGSLTGLTRERTLVHADGTIHGTSHVWIIRRQEASPVETEQRGMTSGSSSGLHYDILLQKRSRNKDSFPGCYDISSAGHIPAGSDFLESALRELEEELGIHAVENELEYIGTHRAFLQTSFYGRPWNNYEISAVYLYEEPVDIRNLTLQQEEIEAVRWMELDACMAEIREGKAEYCIYIDELEMVQEYIRRKSHG